MPDNDRSSVDENEAALAELLAAADSDPGSAHALEGIVAFARARDEFLALAEEIEGLRNGKPVPEHHEGGPNMAHTEPAQAVFPRMGYEDSPTYQLGYKHGYAAGLAGEDDDPTGWERVETANPYVPHDLGYIDGYVQGAHEDGGCFTWGRSKRMRDDDWEYRDLFHGGTMTYSPKPTAR
jgi:hypothetical protein